MSNTPKLEQLRAKTDRQLILIIDQALENGLRLAVEASRRPAEAPALRSRAERCWAEATRLLPTVYTLGSSRRRNFEARARALREALELEIPMVLRAHTAGEAA